MAVCDKTFRIYSREPYIDDIFPIEPYKTIALEEAVPFDCSHSAVRDPGEMKGLDYEATDLTGKDCCEPGNNCC